MPTSLPPTARLLRTQKFPITAKVEDMSAEKGPQDRTISRALAYITLRTFPNPNVHFPPETVLLSCRLPQLLLQGKAHLLCNRPGKRLGTLCEGHSSQAVTLNWRSVWGRDGVLRMRRAEGGKWEAEMLRTLAPRLLPGPERRL